ncbi:MAG TPA: porphobilinogen synthase [Candidatus Dormibacteraeota bacterium]
MLEIKSALPLPARRARRLRRTAALRELVRETELRPSSFVLPLFVAEGISEPAPIESLPGHSRLPLSEVAGAAKQALDLGIRSVLIFGIPARKDASGSEGWSKDGIAQRAIAQLKQAHGDDLVVIADLCLCEYTDHGHCGVLEGGAVDNDRTLELYQRIAESQAEAGADVIAPSGMMDGQVAAIRTALDGGGHAELPVLAYAAKFNSAFYGPFREAAGSAPQFGDRAGYQMDPANGREALRELEQDLAEGADILMVKPALAYLDVLAEARRRFDVPLAAYNVSAEYALVKAGAERGWIDGPRMTLEILTSIRRAGADILITYHALEAARWLAAG